MPDSQETTPVIPSKPKPKPSSPPVEPPPPENPPPPVEPPPPVVVIYEKGKLYQLELAAIQPDPEQPRKYFDAQSLGELQASIVSHGVLQPILVRQGSGSSWLLPEQNTVDTLSRFFQPCPADCLTLVKVSSYVNRPLHDSEECIRPLP